MHKPFEMLVLILELTFIKNCSEFFHCKFDFTLKTEGKKTFSTTILILSIKHFFFQKKTLPNDNFFPYSLNGSIVGNFCPQTYKNKTEIKISPDYGK